MLISKLLHKNELYVATKQQMDNYLSAYLNGEPFRRIVRTKRNSEDSNLYNDCIKNTVAQPITRWVIETINNTVFQPGVQRDLEFVSPTGTELPEEASEWSELFLLDADLQNSSLDSVMENIGTLTSLFGHCWVFVDSPPVQQAQQSIFKPRPYVVAISPQYVWDWQFISVRGVYVPAYIKVLERETTDCYYFKCYYLGTTTQPSYWETYEVEKSELRNGQNYKDLQPIESGTYPLGMTIPGFIAYTKRDPRRFDLGISDIDVAYNVQCEHYKLECDAYQALQFARTLIRADAGVAVPATPGGIVRATEGQIESIPIDTADVDTIINKQNELLSTFQNLAGLGGLVTTSRQVQSGISIVEERRGLYRIAQSKARMLEIAEECIWSFACRFMGVRWSGDVHYGVDYDKHDSTYRLALLKEAKGLLPNNPVIDSIIAKELVKMLVSPEDVEEYEDKIEKTLGNGVSNGNGEDTEEEDTEDTPEQEHIVEDVTDMLPTQKPELNVDKQGNARMNTNVVDTGISLTPQESQAALILNNYNGGGR